MTIIDGPILIWFFIEVFAAAAIGGVIVVGSVGLVVWAGLRLWRWGRA